MFDNPILANIKRYITSPDSEEGLIQVVSGIRQLMLHSDEFQIFLSINLDEIDSLLDDIKNVSEHDIALKYNKPPSRGVKTDYSLYVLLSYLGTEKAVASHVYRFIASIIVKLYSLNMRNLLSDDKLQRAFIKLRLLFEVNRPLLKIVNSSYQEISEICQVLATFSARVDVEPVDKNYARALENTLKKPTRSRVASLGGSRTRTGVKKRTIQKVAPKRMEFGEMGSVITTDLADEFGMPAQECPPATSLIETQGGLLDQINRSSIKQISDPYEKGARTFDLNRRLTQLQNKSIVRPSILQSDELEILLASLRRRADETEKRLNAKLAVWLMLWTGLPVSELFTWTFNGLTTGIITVGGLAYTRCFIPPVLDDDPVVAVCISCPIELFKIAEKLSRRVHAVGLFTSLSATELEDQVASYLKNMNRKNGKSILPERIQHFVLERIRCADREPLCLFHAFARDSFESRTTKFYTCQSAQTICKTIATTWQEISDELVQPDLIPTGFFRVNVLDPELKVGSRRAGSPVAFAKIAQDLQSALNVRRRTVTKSIEKIIRYHNHFVLYTTVMFLAGTGIRAVRNPLQSLHSRLMKGVLVISDKDDPRFATRAVVVPDCFETQMSYLEEHLKALCLIVRPISVELAEKISRLFICSATPQEIMTQICLQKQQLGPLFLIEKLTGGYKAESITPTDWQKIFSRAGLEPNSGRHLLRSDLVALEVGQQQIRQQLGHWGIGESPHNASSTFSIQRFKSSLQPVLDLRMEEQSWQPIRSVLR